MRFRVLAVVAVGVVLLLAGCAAPVAPEQGEPRELDDDRIGYVDGYRYDDSIDVNGSDGFDEAELEAVTARAMARIERERGVNFERTVPVEVITREEYREQDTDFGGSFDEWDEQVWRASFVVDENSSVEEAFEALYGEAVQGYYTTTDGGRIVLVANDPDEVRLDRGTLVHELTHALQHQQYELFRETDTRDERLAWQGLVEGEANYVMYRYDERCESEWECVESRPEDGGDAPEPTFNEGLYLTIFLPYSDGPAFVHRLREREGWEGVDAAYEEPPTSTAQITRPERYPDDPGRTVTVEDRSGDGWQPFEDDDGDVRTDTVGPGSLYAAFWFNDVIERSAVLDDTGEYTIYNYTHPLVDGWDGDVVVPYQADDGDHGYVFRTAWESEADARQFREGYRQLLDDRGGEEIDEGVYRIAERRSFSGAYRIERRDDVVTVVHAPTVEDLDSIHATREPATPTRTATGDAASASAAP